MFLLCFFGKQRDTLQVMFPIIASTDMSPDFALLLARCFWWLLALIWLVMAFAIKKAKRTETPLERLLHIVPLLFGFWLIFGQIRTFRFLHYPLLPAGSILRWTGLLITAVGIAISVWARLSLGANWSGIVTVKAGHELIRKGLYRLIRHPIYTGILLGAIGTGLIQSQLRDLLGFLILYITFYFKAKREESFLQQEFGSSFTEHQQTTGMFWPKFS
jgi:protein-S-isoprenylcysteine O-methyltransferase Ste14